MNVGFVVFIGIMVAIVYFAFVRPFMQGWKSGSNNHYYKKPKSTHGYSLNNKYNNELDWLLYRWFFPSPGYYIRGIFFQLRPSSIHGHFEVDRIEVLGVNRLKLSHYEFGTGVMRFENGFLIGNGGRTRWKVRDLKPVGLEDEMNINKALIES